MIIANSETYNQRAIALTKDVKNILTFMLSMSGMMGCIVMYFLLPIISNDFLYNIEDDLMALRDWRLYCAFIFEFIGFYLVRKNYEINGRNITAINMSLMFSLILVPIYSFFFSDFLGFSSTIAVNYTSNLEFYLFIGVITILTTVFIYDKISAKKISNIPLLLILPISMSNSMFLTGKLMQTYNSFFIGGLIMIPLSIAFIIMAVRKKELKNYTKRKHMSISIKIFAICFFMQPLNSIIVKIIAIEFLTLLKRISQVIAGVIFDKIYNHEIALSTKDKITIFLIIFAGFSLYFFRS